MRTSELLIETRSSGPVGVLTLSGRMTLRDAATVLDALSGAVEQSPLRAAVCDVRHLAVPAAPALLSLFPTALRRAGGWPRASLHLGGPGPGLARLLRAAGTHRRVPVHPDVATALTAARHEAVSVVHQVTLPGEPRSVRTAQAVVLAAWPGLGPASVRDEALLVATELVTNAIRHVAMPFTITLASSPERAMVAVTDPGAAVPSLARPDPETDGGRGMRLVAGLSREWGVRLNHPDGKTVWATLPGAAATTPHPGTSTAEDPATVTARTSTRPAAVPSPRTPHRTP